MFSHPVRLIAGFSLALLAVFSTGCVASRYKMTPKRALNEPVAMNFESVTPQLSTTVNTVIVFRGPGSWKRNAYWDEYVVSLENKSTEPLTIEAVTLTGIEGRATAPGDRPWDIENQSRSVEKRFLAGTGTTLTIGAGFVASVIPSVGVAFTTVMGGTASAGSLFLANVAPPAFLVGTVWRNVSGRKNVLAEFSRRRLVLPVTLQPGERVERSLFFPITPGPQQLALDCKSGTETNVALVPLPGLATLHLATPESGTAKVNR